MNGSSTAAPRGFIVLSQAFKTVLHETYGVPEERISVIPVELTRQLTTPASVWRRLGPRSSGPQSAGFLLTVRRLVKRQGLENLLTAVAELRSRHPDMLLFIGGTGPLSGALAAQIETLGLSEHVKLLGFIPDDKLALTYAAADVSVVPTVAHEGFGLITVESLAAGTPVLVTPVGGLPEVVAGLAPELILRGSEVRDLVAGLDGALSGTLTLPSREACQRYAQAGFDYRTVAERTAAVYREVLGAHRNH